MIITVYYDFTFFKEITEDLKLDKKSKEVYVGLLEQANNKNQGELGKHI